MKHRDIATALAKKLGGQKALAEMMGVSQPSVHAWIAGKAIKGDNLLKLYQLANEYEIINTDVIQSHQESGQRILIQELDVKFGAGGGGMESIAENTTENGIIIHKEAMREAAWEMPTAFLKGELHVNPSKALVAEVVGDSGYDPAHPNAPGSLMAGDRVIIDTEDTRPSPPGAFAIFDGFGLVIKLVEILQGHNPVRLRLSSRNPTYTPYEVTVEEANIVGRIKGRITSM